MNTQPYLAGLFGKPLAQSFSQQMHQAHFAAQGDDWLYLLLELDSSNGALASAIAGTRYLNFKGYNVTKPNKIAVIPLLDELSELAKLIGAVNTVQVVEQRLIGHNTDGEGFVRALIELENFDPQGKTITILGTGGAGRACAYALAVQGARKIRLLNRTAQTAQLLAEEMQNHGFSCAEYRDWQDSILQTILGDSDLLINATGLGMYQSLAKTPIAAELWQSAGDIIACDLTYNPDETQFLMDARAAGKATVNGLGMVIYQGALAYEIWTGKKANIAVMRQAVMTLSGVGA